MLDRHFPRTLAAAMMLSSLLFVGQAQADNIDWDNTRDAARAHSSAIKLAWGALSSWIERRPQGSDPDLTQVRGPHLWRSGPGSPGLAAVITTGAPGGVPPVWNPGWTERGLSFRFCDQVLAVYATEPLRGADMPTVAVEGGLQIIRGSIAKGTPQSGYATVAIPPCMALPSGHVALVATSVDPFGWTATRRRNDHDDWERGCPMPGGAADATVGKVRYAQTRPIEIHPWSGADMDRWPDQCRARPAAGGTFIYAGPVYGAVTGTLPQHGECDPFGPESVGAHIAAAVQNDGCRKPTLIGGTRQPRWHFWDTLCREADSGNTAAIDGGASTHAGVVPETDGSVFLKESDYRGVPFPPNLPAIPACEPRSWCPAPYADGGNVGDRTLIEKRRSLWKQSAPGLVAAGTWNWGTGSRYRRDYIEPGGAASTGVIGVTKGDKWIQENFNGCYDEQVDSSCASRCSCPSGHTGGVPSGFPEIRWYYHEHDPASASNPHIIRQDTCACTACVFIPVLMCGGGDCSPGDTPDGADTTGDGMADSAASAAAQSDDSDFSTEHDGTDDDSGGTGNSEGGSQGGPSGDDGTNSDGHGGGD